MYLDRAHTRGSASRPDATAMSPYRRRMRRNFHISERLFRAASLHCHDGMHPSTTRRLARCFTGRAFQAEHFHLHRRVIPRSQSRRSASLQRPIAEVLPVRSSTMADRLAFQHSVRGCSILPVKRGPPSPAATIAGPAAAVTASHLVPACTVRGGIILLLNWRQQLSGVVRTITTAPAPGGHLHHVWGGQSDSPFYTDSGAVRCVEKASIKTLILTLAETGQGTENVPWKRWRSLGQ